MIQSIGTIVLQSFYLPDKRTEKSGQIQDMKLIFHRQTDRIVPRGPFPRSAEWLAMIFIGLSFCVVHLRSETAEEENAIYDPDPKHLWNRLHEVLFVRTAPNGKRYGFDRLDPLFWSGTE